MHPEGALNADEISHNTNSTKDKLQGNEKRIHVNGERAQKIASESDVAWTMLAVTALTGEPVCCVVIIEGKRLAAEDMTGEDIMVSQEGCEDISFLNQENHGPDKRFPGGPSCSFRNIQISAFVTFSDSGGVTSSILTDIMRHIDRCNVFKRGDTDNFTPTIQLDGHHTRFGLDFLDYCRKPDTKWSVSIGCPESTHLWQIQDSSEMNGLNKRWTYHYKDQLLAFKRRMNLPLIIKRPDIIPIVNRAWKRSFAIVKSNRSAIEERGWNPPNMALLHHPAILATKPQPQLNNTSTTPIALVDNENNVSENMITSANNVMEDLNYHSGQAGEMITDIVMWAKTNDDLKQNVQKRIDERKSFHEKAKEVKRLSPGFFFTNRKLAVTSDDVYFAVKQRSDARLEKEKEVVRKALKDRMKMEDSVKRILAAAKRYILDNPQTFPDGAPPEDELLSLQDIPVSFLAGTTTKTLLRFMSMKKKGDKGISKLNTAEAKAMWKEVSLRTPYSTNEYLTEERGFRCALVEEVMSELPNVAPTGVRGNITAVTEVQAVAQLQPHQPEPPSTQHHDEGGGDDIEEGGASL